MRCLGISAARPAPQVRSLPVSFPGRQFDAPIALQPHRIAAAILAAIVFGSCCSETHAQQVAALHIPHDHSDKAVSAFILEASRRFDIPVPWIRAVMRVESAGNLRALSPKGAIGLMQIMPETWSDLRSRYQIGVDPYDAHDNIIAGTAYLRELYDRYGAPGFLAAYNAGPARWEDHLPDGKPLPLETRVFLVRVAPVPAPDAINDAVLNAPSARSWTDAPLFPTLATNTPNGNRATSDLQAVRSTDSRSPPDSMDHALRSDGIFVVLIPTGQLQ